MNDATTNDDDFQALLGHNKLENSMQEHALNLDHLTREKQNLSPKRCLSDGGGGGGDKKKNEDNHSNNVKKHTTRHIPKSTPRFFQSGLFDHDGGGILARLSSYASMLCYFHPCICGTLVFLVIGSILFGLGSLIFNPRVDYGVMKHDHSFLPIRYNEKMAEIDHWCLRGDNKSCQCEDPLVPTHRADRKSWRLAFKINRKIVQRIIDSAIPLDVIFLGESIVEEMDGRWMGQGRSPVLKEMAQLFESRFSRGGGGSGQNQQPEAAAGRDNDGNENSNSDRRNDPHNDDNDQDTNDTNNNNNNNRGEGSESPASGDGTVSGGGGGTGKLNAVALGIAGDTAPNVLWRLMHGEMEVKPKIWWLSLGMNDLSRMQCSEEVVVLGILRVVEQLMEAQPEAHIVLNSLFPMVRIRGAAYPKRTDYQDSLRSGTTTSQTAMKNSLGGGVVEVRPVTETKEKGGNSRKRRLEAQDYQSRGALGLRGNTKRSLMGGMRRRKRNRMQLGQPQQDQRPRTEEEKEADEEDARFEAQGGRRRQQMMNRFRWFNRNTPAMGKKAGINPVLVEQHKIRKHVQDIKLPLWTSVVTINKALETFAQRNKDRVTFFDVTPLFTRPSADGETRKILKTNLISITGHPTREGFDQWEEQVATIALDILKEMKKTKPHLFPKMNNNNGSVNNNNNNNNPTDNNNKNGGGDGTGDSSSSLDVDDYFDFSNSQDPTMHSVLDFDQMLQEEDNFADEEFTTHDDYVSRF